MPQMGKLSVTPPLHQTMMYNGACMLVPAQQDLVNVHRATYMHEISGFRIHRCLKSRFTEYVAALTQPPFLNSDRIREGGLCGFPVFCVSPADSCLAWTARRLFRKWCQVWSPTQSVAWIRRLAGRSWRPLEIRSLLPHSCPGLVRNWI